MKRRISVWNWLVWLALPFLFWFAWRQIPVDRLSGYIQSAEAWQVGVLVITNLLILWLSNMRWWMILRSLGHTLPYLLLAVYRLAGFAISYLTPGTQIGGEPLQVALLQRRHNLSVATSFASITLDKLLEMLANYIFLTFLLLVVVQGEISQSLLGINLLWPVLGLVFWPVVHLAVLRQGLRPVTALFAWLSPRLHKPKVEFVYQVVRQMEDQVGVFCQDHLLVILFSVFFSLGVWVLVALEYWLVYAFLGLPLALPQLVLLIAATRLAFLTPLPGGLGALEASQVLALQALGLDPAFGIGAVLWIRLRDLTLAGTGAWLGAVLSRSKPAVPHPIEVNIEI